VTEKVGPRSGDPEPVISKVVGNSKTLEQSPQNFKSNGANEQFETGSKIPRGRDFEANGLFYCCTASYFADNTIGEIFISNAKVNSHSDAAAKDSAIVTSLAFQHGVPLESIRRALLRDARGVASSPLGVALDILADEP
jgi:hypothetical protein